MTTSDTSAPLDRARLHDLVARSIELIETEQAPSGAYPACPTYPVYNFAWLRDGSFVADAMGTHGRGESAAGFHDWVSGVVVGRRDQVDAIVAVAAAGGTINPAECLPTRYTLEGGEGPPHWWDFQLDGYGIWLWALGRHLQRGAPDAARYRDAVRLTARYLTALWRTPCYDWWEEHIDQVHVATLTAILAGLRAALDTGVLGADLAAAVARATEEISATIATDGVVAGRLRKWLGSEAVDASLLPAIAPFDVVGETMARATLATVESDLLVDHGVYRYRADVFYGGGRWPVLAGLLGQAYVRYGRLTEAEGQLVWIAGTADATGRLPEQISDRLLAPGSYQEWVDRWGPVARPLLWSHASYLSLAAELGIRT